MPKLTFGFSESSVLNTPITIPHSITNWTITGRFWTPNSPVCEVQTEIGIDMSAYMEIEIPSTVYAADQMLTKVVIYNFETSQKKVALWFLPWIFGSMLSLWAGSFQRD